MQVVAEQLDVRNRRGTHVWVLKVPREQHKRDETRIVGARQTGHLTDLERRLAVRVQHLRRILDRRLTARVDKLLEKHFAENAVRLLSKARAKHNRHTVGRGQDVHGLVGAVLDRNQRTRGGHVAALLQLRLLGKRALKWRGHCVPLQ